MNKFEIPSIEVSRFTVADLIATSTGGGVVSPSAPSTPGVEKPGDDDNTSWG